MIGTSPFGRRFGFGDIFRQMEQEMADFERRFDQMLEASRESDTGSTGQQRGPYVYGWTVQVGPDGVPRVRQFGNTEQVAGTLEEGWREPFVTQFFDEDKSVIRLTAELPGIQKENIDVKTFPDGVTIEATGEDRKYRTEVPVERELDPETADASYNNGILEVTIQLAEHERREGRSVDIR